MDESRDNHHLDRCQFSDGPTEHQPNNAVLEAAEGNSKKKHFTSLVKLQKRINCARAFEASPRRISFHALILYREAVVRECVDLARRIRRKTALCFAPPSAGDEDDLPYMQLDKVTHALIREAFGPLYLVT